MGRDLCAKLAKEKKNGILRFISALAIAGLIFYVIHLLYTDELRFIGRNNVVKKGVIIETKFYRAKGGYKQRVRYEFEYKNIEYRGIFRVGEIIGEQYVGDSVLIKFRASDPTISKWVKTIYE